MDRALVIEPRHVGGGACAGSADESNACAHAGRGVVHIGPQHQRFRAVLVHDVPLGAFAPRTLPMRVIGGGTGVGVGGGRHFLLGNVPSAFGRGEPAHEVVGFAQRACGAGHCPRRSVGAVRHIRTRAAGLAGVVDPSGHAHAGLQRNVGQVLPKVRIERDAVPVDGQVAWRARAWVVGSSVGEVGRIVSRRAVLRAILASQPGAAGEHIAVVATTASHAFGRPSCIRRRLVFRHENGFQDRTAVEHILDVFVGRRVEIVQVKLRQFRAAVEHIQHGCHTVGVEIAQIHAGKARAAAEHVTHVCDARRPKRG